MLGVEYDCKLLMRGECHFLARQAGWKLRTLLRARRFYNEQDLVTLYKTHLLPFLEFATPAVYHAATTTLAAVDRVQARFLREVELTAEEALLRYNLAPLCARRDMAMLGVIHRTTLGKGPPHFREWFYPATKPEHRHNTRLQAGRHNRQLHDYVDGSHTELLRNSALGLVRVYNGLPQRVVDAKTVASFQHLLQQHLKDLVRKQTEEWQTYYSPRR